MIKITCTQLEQVRRNPVQYAETLADNDVKNVGGTRGMFACVKDTIRDVHGGDINVKEGIKELQSKFIRFDETVKNKAKQDKLVEQYIKYHTAFDKMNFKFLDGIRLMRWPIHHSVMLTGQTPWTFKNESNFSSYFITETYIDNWQSQLRFPLIQQYLAENNIRCDVTDLKVGLYSFSTGTFEFKSFNKNQLQSSLTETNALFQSVNDEYEKRKK